MDRITRRAARILVLDHDDHLLLFHGFDPSDPSAGDWWFTPGGGLEGDESFVEAARRELAEETGLQSGRLEELPGERVAEFPFDGQLVTQTERYFTVRVARFEPVSDAWTDLEIRSTIELRWWGLDEFRAADLRHFPADLVQRWAVASGLVPRVSD
ncbi:MAG: NUDIX domain-containing protein [Pseudolysinimonas sp.]|uniref:NUDIX hydrolase n=1 Tax=Pseudolysinimonas sp. TaxID=2680009 RepID=UPI003266681A